MTRASAFGHLYKMALIAGIAGVTAAATFFCYAAAQPSPAAAAAPSYTADGRLEFPKDYRSWIYLSSGLDMSYVPGTRSNSVFDNVFVNRDSYDAFVKTGTWPDKTVLVLEIRNAGRSAAILAGGQFQGEHTRTEVHVKDAARFPGGWAFFGFGDETSAAPIPQTATCYSCHRAHGAVDTTFVQFYPTLLPLAQAKGTLSQGYLADEAKPAAHP